MNKSLLFKPLSENEINKIMREHFSCEAESFKLLKGGMFNTSYLVKLENGIRAVLRVSPEREDILLPFDKNLNRAELYACELLEREGIPTNKPITADFSREIIPRDYVIFEYINGFPLSSKSVKRKNKKDLYKQTGEYARKIHNIRGEYYGRVSDSFDGISFSSWTEFIIYEINKLCRYCVDKKVLTLDDTKEICKLFERGKYLFDSVTEPRLVHGDLWTGNVMVSEAGDSVSAVIDIDRCIFGDPDRDLAAPWMITEGFLCGYGEIPNDKSRELKLLYYRLIYAVIDAYVWKIEYRNKRMYKQNMKNIKRLIKKIEKESKE